MKKSCSEKLHNIQKKTLLFSCEYCVTFKDTYFDKHLRTVASEKEALIFWSFSTHWDMMGFSPFSFRWFFIRDLLFDYFTNKCIHLRKKILQILLMYIAVFKYIKSSASLWSKLLFLFPSWLVLQNSGVWFDT